MTGLLERIKTSSMDCRKLVGLAADLRLAGCDNKAAETTPVNPTILIKKDTVEWKEMSENGRLY
jgi:uncharacterized lipoprotein YajG